MLREFRRADGPAFVRLLKEQFPQEEAVLGTDPEATLEIVRRVFRWDARLFLRFAQAIGRPIVRMYVAEVDGRVAGITILTFTERAGFLSNVVVDGPFRRRGLAQQLLERAHRDARAHGRQFTVLDVVSDNGPARALYDAAGYRPLRSQSVMVRDPIPTASSVSDPTSTGVRPFRPGDAGALERLATQNLPPEVARVLPAERSQFRVRGIISRVLRSETRAWVLDSGSGPVGFVRGTVSGAMAAANLSCPILAPSVETGAARSLVAEAL
ncbi:MAG: GNAT family N-acetyltransferase, partial [Thermoplasmata archaeon]|nr:GNAT family N-acetyltransferase [Thermoplasmata archaeon]